MTELRVLDGSGQEGSHVDVTWLARQIDGRRTSDIRDRIAALISDGTLAPGLRLPTLRDLARELQVTPSVVSDAWMMLRRDGFVETRRRGGTRVLSSYEGFEERFHDGFAGWHSVEMLHAMPDLALLPDTADAFARAVDHDRPVVSRPTISSELRDAAEVTWNFRAESFTSVTGGWLALELSVRAALGPEPGVIAVEVPSMARNATLVTSWGDRVVDVHSDREGPRLDSVIAALEAGASVFVFQPHGRIPVGSRLSERRRDELANVFKRLGPSTWIVEEDPVGPLFTGTSMGAALPQRTVRLSQYWRAFGPDVDTVVIGGSAVLVDRIREVQRARGLRAGSVQQAVLAHLLVDPQATNAVEHATARYRRRHDLLAQALDRHGVPVLSSSDGLFACIRVDDALNVASVLSVSGIRVLGGTSSSPDGPFDFVRVATTRLPEESDRLDELAAAVARAVNEGGVVDAE